MARLVKKEAKGTMEIPSGDKIRYNKMHKYINIECQFI